MSDSTYNTNHGTFCIKKDNIPNAVKAIAEHNILVDPTFDFGSALSYYGLGCTVDLDDNVIDIYLSDTSYFSDDILDMLLTIGPTVEPGSYLVFYGGGADGCWAIAYDGDGPPRERDVEAVVLGDLRTMLRELRAAGAPCYKTMLKRYPHVSDSLLAAGFVGGARVRAKRTITEGGAGVEPDDDAAFPDKHYVHAKVGDTGVVTFIDSRDYPTVLFDRTGTSTIVGESEVEVITDEPAT